MPFYTNNQQYSGEEKRPRNKAAGLWWRDGYADVTIEQIKGSGRRQISTWKKTVWR